MATLTGIGGERYWVHIPTTKPRAYKSGGLVAAAEAVKGSPMANEYGDTELVHVNKYEMEKLREMWGEPGINPETGLPAYGWFGKLLGKVAKVAGTVILTPVLGPVGAAAAVEAASGVVRGDSIGQILKSSALAGATAAGAQIGGKVLPSLVGVSQGAGQAIGAGIGTFGGQVATGASLKDAATSGVTSGLGTYVSNQAFDKAIDKNILGIGDASRFLAGIGRDISGATGIDLGGDTRGWFKPAPPAPMIASQVDLVPNATEGLSFDSFADPGDIIVNSYGRPVITTGGGRGGEPRTDTKDSTEDEPATIVTGAEKPVITTVGTPAANTPPASPPPPPPPPPPGEEKKEIVVTGPGKTVITPTPPTQPPPKEPPPAPPPAPPPPPPPPPPDPKDVVLIDPGTIPPTSPPTVPLVPRGGTYDVNPNRSDIFGKRGIANIGFDPFTYGQATGDQPEEFIFFTQNPVTGAVTAVPAPSAAGIGNTYTGSRSGPAPYSSNFGGGSGGQPSLQPFNSELSQKLLDRAAQVEAINQRYKSQYGLQDSDIEAMFQGTYGLNMADSANSPNFEAARLISSPYLSELENIYGDLPTMRLALSSPVNALGRTRDSLSQLEVARNRAQQSLVDTSSPEYEQQYLAYMTGATEQMPPAPIGFTPEEYTRRMGIVRGYGPDIAYDTIKNWNDTRSQYPDRVAAERADYESVRNDATGTYNYALADLNRGAGIQSATAPITTPVPNQPAAPAMLAPSGNTFAEGGEVDDDMASHLMSYYKRGGHTGPGQVKGIGSGQEDKIAAWLSDGEYVWSAQDVADLGDGSTDEGVRRLDKMRHMVRRRAGRKDVKKIAKPQKGIDHMLKAVGGSK